MDHAQKFTNMSSSGSEASDGSPRTFDFSTNMSKHQKSTSARIPIGRVTYSLSSEQLPQLYVIEVQMTCQDSEENVEFISSTKLRKLPFRELKKNDAFISVFAKHSNALIMEDRMEKDASSKADKNTPRHLTDLLVVPLPAGDPEPDFGSLPRSIGLAQTKETAKKQEKEKDQAADKSITCTPSKGKMLNHQSDRYLARLTELFRCLACRTSESSAEFLYPSEELMFKDQSLSKFLVRVRQKPSFESHDKASRWSLHLNYDLVPAVDRAETVLELVQAYFAGPMLNTLLPDHDRANIALKKLLCGLQVQHHKTNEETPHNDADNQLLRSKRVYSNRLSSMDLDRDVIVGSNTQNKFESILSEYKKAHSKRVGMKDESSSWPHAKSIYACFPSYEALRFSKFTDQRLSNAGPTTQANSENVSSRARVEIPSDIVSRSRYNLVMVYVTQEPLNHDRKDWKPFLRRITNGFQTQKYVPVNHTIPIVKVNGIGDLISSQADTESELMNAVVANHPGILLGIVDKAGSEGTQSGNYRQVLAELVRFADRRIGAVPVCLSWQHLSNTFEMSGGKIPKGLLDKLNFMLSGTNWNTKPLKTLPGGNGNRATMVDGAHIAHPNSTSATGFSPSSAALVASLEPNPIHYGGSARVQNTYKFQHNPASQRGRTPTEIPKGTVEMGTSRRKKKDTKLMVESKIVHLQDMMEERFRAWKVKINDIRPTDILFYRSSISLLDCKDGTGKGSIPGQEKEHIVDAYRKVFGDDVGPPKLTYVIMNNNTGGHGSSKQYTLVLDDMSITADGVTNLTKELNELDQRTENPHNVIALPIQYATKLARRQMDYYRFTTAKDLSSIPAIGRITDRETKNSVPGCSPDQMRNWIEEYIMHDTTKGIVDARFKGPGYTEIEKDLISEDAENRKLPWRPLLDDTMFNL